MISQSVEAGLRGDALDGLRDRALVLARCVLVADQHQAERPAPRAQKRAGGDEVVQPLVLYEGADVADHRHVRRNVETRGEIRVAAARGEAVGIDGIGQQRDRLAVDATLDQLVAHRSGQGEDVVGALARHRLPEASGTVNAAFWPNSGSRDSRVISQKPRTS